MRRHSIIARLDPADTQAVGVHEMGSVETELRFIDGERRLGFGLGQMIDGLGERGIFPSERAIDLALLAASVTAADTRISRNTESQDSWTREIDLYIPVQDRDVWTAYAGLIARTLGFLTGDRWRIFFRARRCGIGDLIDRPPELVGASFSSVCLFSGGLDSFVGAIDLLHAGENPFFVSHYWDASTSSQTLCAERIGEVFGDMQPRHVRARQSGDRVAGSMSELGHLRRFRDVHHRSG